MIFSWIKHVSIDLFRYFTKGARIDAALEFEFRHRHNAGDVGLKPGSSPIEFSPGKFGYNAEDLIRKWEISTKYKLKLKNNSTATAYNVTLLNSKEIFSEIEPIPKLLSIAPNEEIKFEVEFRQLHFGYSGVDADNLPGIPAEKEHRILNIQYQNEAGTKMYTKFWVSSTDPRIEYSW